MYWESAGASHGTQLADSKPALPANQISGNTLKTHAWRSVKLSLHVQTSPCVDVFFCIGYWQGDCAKP